MKMIAASQSDNAALCAAAHLAYAAIQIGRDNAPVLQTVRFTAKI